MKKFLISYFLFSFFFFMFFASGFIDSQDGFQYLAVARRMYHDKTFEMPIEDYPDRRNIHLSRTKSKDGKSYSPTGLGYSISLLPAVFLEDVFLELSSSEPISAFPLENDWPVLLFTSMTNAFWGALFVVFLYLFFKEVNIKHKDSLLLSFSFAVGTNIFVHTKHTFPHMMFVALMTGIFLSLKLYSKTNKKLFMFLSGLSYGLVILTYNPTYLLILPAIGLYYLFTTKFKLSINDLLLLIKNIVIAFLGLLPSLYTYFWFNNIRFGGATHTGYGSAGIPLPTIPPAYVILEGIWGLLLSPGKSIFIYSPILLILILFWFKFKKKYLPELIAGLTIFFIYLWQMGTLLGDVDFLVWHGDSSWGPRYMLPILPLLFVVIAVIYKELSKKQKYFVFYPLIILGFFINLLSVLLPYQIRFAGLQTDAHFNNRNFNVYEYGNEIPRYMPAFKMSKTLVKRVKNIPNTYNYGDYNTRFYDGFDVPFNLGWAVWRGMQPASYIKFDDKNEELQKLTLQIKNHQMNPDSSQSATLKVLLNENTSNPIIATISADNEKEIILNLTDHDLKKNNNIVEINSSYESSTAAELKKDQVLFLQILRLNDLPQNLWTIDYPYVSQVSKGMYDAEYNYWGSQQNDPWEIWHMHSGVYEQTFDLWWLRPLHYWDLPKGLFLVMFLTNIVGLVYYGILITRMEIYEKNNSNN